MRRESVRILARSAEGRGRSTGPVARPDYTLLSVFHSWTIVSVTAVTFTVRSVHSRAADPDTLHFQGPAAARARSRMAIDILPAVACPSTATAPRYSRPSRPRRRLSEVQLTSGLLRIMGLTRHAATRCSRSRFPSSDESRPRRLVSSRLVAYRSSVSWVSLWCSRVWGRLSSPPQGRFRQSRRRICRAEIRRTEGVQL